MKHVRVALVLLLSLILPGCLVQTDTFLSERTSSTLDERLLGIWIVPGNEDENGFLFVRESEGGGMDILTLELNEAPSGTHQLPKWDEAVVWSTDVGGMGYLNMTMDDASVILAYRISDAGALEIGFMKPDMFKAAITSGAIKGTLKKSFLGPDLRLTDTAENITAYIKNNGGHALFAFVDGEERLVLVRKRLEK